MSSVFKIYSPEDCDFYYDGELQGHIDGNSDRAFRFEVERKGAYRLKFVNSEYKSELIVKVSIDADEEREVELDFSEVNEPVIREREERIIIAIEHDYEVGQGLPKEIISAISNNGIITIPKGVRKIGDRAFADFSSLTSITIPDSVIEIGKSAFADCCSLKSIIIPNSVTEIGESAFLRCSSLTSITLPDSITKIGREVFLHCRSLTSITIPNGVTEIGNRSFYDCGDLTSITLPVSITKIGDCAFTLCSKLKSIIIPNSVIEIGEEVFAHCSNLTAFYGKYASYNNRCLIKDGILLAFAPAPYDITEFTIPDSVTAIGANVFAKCSGLKSIIIPNGVTEIGNCAFSYCNNLKSIIVPNSITKIGDWAFSDCESLTSINIPNGVTKIGDHTFSDCSSLTSINIPNSVTVIRKNAFAGCKRLTTITIPNSVTEIGASAFAHCCNLTAFYGKYASHDNRCLIKDGILLAFAPAPYDITEYNDIKEYTIPDSVTTIGENVFSRCRILTSITIPNCVTEIGNCAFSNCSNLTSVYCKATTPPKIRHSLLWTTAFDYNASDRKIYVPKSEESTILEAYKLANDWRRYKDDIYEYDFDNE